MARGATAVQADAGTAVMAGIIGGLVFAVFEMMATAALMGAQAFFMPLRMIGAIALGPEALDPGYSLVTAASAGVGLHMVLSVIFALVFAVSARAITSPTVYLGAGLAFGVALWLVNFYLIAPIAGWTWFPEGASPLIQFTAHAFFFGLPVAWILGHERRTIVIEP